MIFIEDTISFREYLLEAADPNIKALQDVFTQIFGVKPTPKSLDVSSGMCTMKRAKIDANKAEEKLKSIGYKETDHSSLGSTGWKTFFNHPEMGEASTYVDSSEMSITLKGFKDEASKAKILEKFGVTLGAAGSKDGKEISSKEFAKLVNSTLTKLEGLKKRKALTIGTASKSIAILNFLSPAMKGGESDKGVQAEIIRELKSVGLGGEFTDYYGLQISKDGKTVASVDINWNNNSVYIK